MMFSGTQQHAVLIAFEDVNIRFRKDGIQLLDMDDWRNS